jgi:hypothetical protein
MAWQTINGTFSDTTELDYEAFCCGQTLMEDGKIVITGSNFIGPYPQEPGPEVATYNPVTNTWTKSPQPYELNRKRYYPSTIRMPDGRIITLGGQATNPPSPPPGEPSIPPEFVDRPFEINPNIVNVLATWQMPFLENWNFLNYPVVFPLSQTELFFPGPARSGTEGDPTRFKTFYFSTSDATEITPIDLGGYTQTWHGPIVMYRPGMIMKCGGVEALTSTYTLNNVLATNNAEKIDINNLASRPTWSYITPMNHARIDHNAVILADGRVFVVGGTLYHDPPALRENENNWVQSGEIWNPDTNTWTMTANLNTSGGGQAPVPKVFRGYHSTAILMPDGRVLLAGGDVGWPNEQTSQPPSAHFYLPNYGSGTRPEITSGPDQIEIGSGSNSIIVSDIEVTKIALVGLGAVTHSYDMNQR